MANTQDTCDELVFDSMKVKELREYLKKHGQTQSGIKQELVRRAKGTFQLLQQRAVDAREKASVAQQDTGDKTDTEIHEVELEDKTVTKLKGWMIIDSVSSDDWPGVTDKDLYNYLVYTCQKTVDLKSKKARRQLKAHTFYDDRHVHSVSYHPITEDSDQCYVRCLVIPSFAASDKTKYPDRAVWVRASKITGQIRSAYCTCTAGLEGSCNHVAALLYAMVDITASKNDGMDASTSKTCKWKQPRKRRLSPKKSAHFKRVKADDGHHTQPRSGVNIARFAARLSQCAPESGWLINYTAREVPVVVQGEATQKYNTFPTVPDPQFMFRDNVDISSESSKKVFSDFVENMISSCTPEDRILTEQATREQGKSKLWFAMRDGRLTASNFGEVCRRKPETKPDNLLKTVLGYRSIRDNTHLKWGRSHEPAARRSYHNKMKLTHPGIQVKKSGLILDELLPFLAASPDGTVTCSHCSPTQGLLEVKCPSVHRDKTPAEACEDKTFFCHLVEGHVTLKKNHPYYFQIQGQMGVSGRQWCDFVVWTLKGHTIERISFDKDLWAQMVKRLQEFYVSAVVPELFTHRVKRGKSLYA